LTRDTLKKKKHKIAHDTLAITKVVICHDTLAKVVSALLVEKTRLQ